MPLRNGGRIRESNGGFLLDIPNKNELTRVFTAKQKGTQQRFQAVMTTSQKFTIMIQQNSLPHLEEQRLSETIQTTMAAVYWQPALIWIPLVQHARTTAALSVSQVKDMTKKLSVDIGFQCSKLRNRIPGCRYGGSYPEIRFSR